MTYLLDTCTILWAARDADRLSHKVRNILSSGSPIAVSAISVAEISIKVVRGKLMLHTSLPNFLEELRTEVAFDYLPLTPAHSFRVLNLPSIHRDPFDRLLICQAIEHQLTILTPDPLIQQYNVLTAW